VCEFVTSGGKLVHFTPGPTDIFTPKPLILFIDHAQPQYRTEKDTAPVIMPLSFYIQANSYKSLRCPERSNMIDMGEILGWGGYVLFCFVFDFDLFKRLYREVLVFMGYDCH